MAKVLINDVVTKYILGQHPTVRDRIRDKFEYLESGIWDTGLRVKKLKGITAWAVFEGRLDRGTRILFTLGKQVDGELLIYVWGIVEHDEVSHKALQITPKDVAFLNFRSYGEEEHEGLDLTEVDQTLKHGEIGLDPSADDSATQRWHPLDETQWARIQTYARDDFSLYLNLSPDQEDLLRTPPPMIIAGTAGSGKTTTAIYYLFKEELRKRKVLFVTYNHYLRDDAARLYRGLLSGREDEANREMPRFLTFRDLCLELVRKGDWSYRPEDEVFFDRFRRILAGFHEYRGLDAALVWEEIRAIIKGALPQVSQAVLLRAQSVMGRDIPDKALLRRLQDQFQTFMELEDAERFDRFTRKFLKASLVEFVADMERYIRDQPERVRSVLGESLKLLDKHKEIAARSHLSLLAYELYGRKKAPNFQEFRKQIYGVFERYQAVLKERGWYDEMDLTREASRICHETPSIGSYDLVICDEVQDLTDMQNHLLFLLVKDPRDVILCGDTRQIINPSGFRWEELKRQFYERGLSVPPIHTLSTNYRSSGSIVALANELLHFKRKLLGSSAQEKDESWLYRGRPPMVLTGVQPESLYQILGQMGVGQAILVRSEAQRDRLRRHLDTELIFTIREAKGLEFETVVLWHFCSAPMVEEVWRHVLEPEELTDYNAAIRHELNLFYVGVTRARSGLIIYDGPEPSLMWQDPRLLELVFLSDDLAYLSNLWQVVSSDAQWLEQAHYFMEREQFAAAKESFKNAGDERLFHLAEARLAERKGLLHLAAEAYLAYGDRREAARCFQADRQYGKALPLWQELGELVSAEFCRGEIAHQNGDFPLAGEIRLAQNRLKEALESYQAGGCYSEAAAIAIDLGQRLDAAHFYTQAKAHARAAALYEELAEFELAARQYFLAQDYGRAEELWRELNYTDGLIEVYRITDQLEPLLALLEERKVFNECVTILRRLGGDYSEEAEDYLNTGDYFRAYIRYHVMEDKEGQGEALIGLGQHQDAVRMFKSAGDPLKMAYAMSYIDAEKALYFLNRQDLPIHDIRRQGFEIASRLGPDSCEKMMVKAIEKSESLLTEIFSLAIGICFPKGLMEYLLESPNDARTTWSSAQYIDDIAKIVAFLWENHLTDEAGEFLIVRDIYNFRLPGGKPLLEQEECRIIHAVMGHFLMKKPSLRSYWESRIHDIELPGKTLLESFEILEMQGNWEYCAHIHAMVRLKGLPAHRQFIEALSATIRKKEETLIQVQELSFSEQMHHITRNKLFYEALAHRMLLVGERDQAATILIMLKADYRNCELYLKSDNFLAGIAFLLAKGERELTEKQFLENHLVRDYIRNNEIKSVLTEISGEYARLLEHADFQAYKGMRIKCRYHLTGSSPWRLRQKERRLKQSPRFRRERIRTRVGKRGRLDYMRDRRRLR